MVFLFLRNPHCKFSLKIMNTLKKGESSRIQYSRSIMNRERKGQESIPLCFLHGVPATSACGCIKYRTGTRSTRVWKQGLTISSANLKETVAGNSLV